MIARLIAYIENTAMQINILEAKNRLSQIIQSALAGEEVVIANRGNPVVRLVPIDQDNGHIAIKTLSQWLTENPLPEHLKATQTIIDDSIEAQRDSWD